MGPQFVKGVVLFQCDNFSLVIAIFRGSFKNTKILQLLTYVDDCLFDI